MQTVKQLIQQSGTGWNAPMVGRTFYVQGCDSGSTLTVVLTDSLGNTETVVGVGAGCKLTPAAGFKNILVTTTADANVQFIVTSGDIDIQLTQLGTNITNTNANPVPVAIVSEPGAPFQVAAPVGQEVNVKVQGTVAVTGATLTATNVGLVPSGSAVTDIAAVAVGTAGAQVIAASAGRKRLIFRNTGAGQLAITAASGTTFANAAIVLQPGDAWKESDAPQLAWYAVSDVGTNVAIQSVG